MRETTPAKRHQGLPDILHERTLGGTVFQKCRRFGKIVRANTEELRCYLVVHMSGYNLSTPLSMIQVKPVFEWSLGITTAKFFLTAWHVLFRCAWAEEAEGQACAEGLRLVLQWCSGPPILKSNSARLVAAIGDSKDDRLEIRWTVLEAKELCSYWLQS